MASGTQMALLVVGVLFGVLASVKSDFKEEALFAHNTARQQHQDTPDLVWDDMLASQASNYAMDILLKNYYRAEGTAITLPHSSFNVGENLYAGYYGQYSTTHKTIAEAVEAWYAEGRNYDYSKIVPYGEDWHFTQVIWKSSTKVGCGKSFYTTKDLKPVTFFVCQYLARGNISIGFLRNVMGLKSGGKSHLSAEQLTPIKRKPAPGTPCTDTDTGPTGGCTGMGIYCYDNSVDKTLRDWLLANCAKTCNC